MNKNTLSLSALFVCLSFTFGAFDSINYTSSNATTLSASLSHTNTILNEATGFNLFYPVLLMSLFFGASVFGSKYGFERAVLFSSIFTTFAAFTFVAAGIMGPEWLILCITLSAIFYFIEV